MEGVLDTFLRKAYEYLHISHHVYNTHTWSITAQKWDCEVTCQYGDSILPLGRVGETHSLHNYVLLESFIRRVYLWVTYLINNEK